MPTVVHQIKSTSGSRTISVPSQSPERSEATEATNSARLAAWRDEIKAMLAGAKIAVGQTWTVELSHHHGLEHFDEVGCTLITCIERAYCKKLLILFAGQMHPEHYHKEKEETFEVLSGTFLLNLNGERRLMFPGEAQTILPGQWHGFTSEHGCIIEEISMRYLSGSSVYRPDDVRCLDRKTTIRLE